MTVPVEGSVGIEGEQNPAPLTGTFAIRQFAQAGSGIVAIGTLTATYTPGSSGEASAVEAQANGARTVVAQISLPVSGETPSAPQPAAFDTPRFTSPPQARPTGCDALHVALGPAEMTVLQLNVALDPIALDIAATSAATAARPGNAGELQSVLCSIASQLDGAQQGRASTVVDLLNQLLDLLG